MYKKLSITRGDEMKDQRGSVTVMSLAMLLFLMVVSLAADDDNGKNGCCV